MDKRIPLRTCLGCNICKPKNDMLRIVMGQDGKLSVDKEGRMNGRGSYLCRNMACLRNAVKRKGFNRAYKKAIPLEELEHFEEEFNKIIGEKE